MKPEFRYDSLFQYWSEQEGLDWRLIKRQCEAESSLNPFAHDPATGAAGLAQFRPDTWTEAREAVHYAPSISPYDVEPAIRCMCWYMHHLARMFPTYREALAAYNWGMGHVSRHPKPEEWPKETRAYVAKIIGLTTTPIGGMLTN